MHMPEVTIPAEAAADNDAHDDGCSDDFSAPEQNHVYTGCGTVYQDDQTHADDHDNDSTSDANNGDGMSATQHNDVVDDDVHKLTMVMWTILLMMI